MNEASGNETTGNEETGALMLNLECTLNAPRERIFRMLTEPAELVKWWGPHGFTIPEPNLNLVVGGRYRFTMKPPAANLPPLRQVPGNRPAVASGLHLRVGGTHPR